MYTQHIHNMKINSIILYVNALFIYSDLQINNNDLLTKQQNNIILIKTLNSKTNNQEVYYIYILFIFY